MSKRLLLFLILGVIIIGAIGFFSFNMKKTTKENKAKKFTVVLHTEKGNIAVSLNADQTPITVNNFVTLAKKGFYNNFFN